MATKPTHEQAQLHLQVYEMRREDRLRKARSWYSAHYFPKDLKHALEIAPMGSENGTNVMMVLGYWEHACALLNYELLHEDLFFETSGEFYDVWDREKPTLAEGREMWKMPHFLAHMEKAAARYETWIEKRAPGHLATMREMIQSMRSESKSDQSK